MARTKAALGSGVRLSDHLSASLLARVFFADAVGATLDLRKCNSQLLRSCRPVPSSEPHKPKA